MTTTNTKAIFQFL